MLTETGNIIENMEDTLYNKINNAIIGKNKENRLIISVDLKQIGIWKKRLRKCTRKT